VLGISADKSSAQKKFKDANQLPFSLLADPDKTVIQQFGVLKEKSMYGRKYMGIERTTFVIGPQGKITSIISGIKAEEHAETVLSVLTTGKSK
jgi:peroxiredoxin Q/BCP